MTINRNPYYDTARDRWYVDKDPDNQWTYVADMTSELTLNNTTASTCTAIVSDSRITVLAGPTVQTPGNLLIKVKFSGPVVGSGTYTDDAFITLRTVCANGDQFDKTIWVKPVQD
jgi:hypothetical protein